MAKVNVYDLECKIVGGIELEEAVFGVQVNEHLLYDMIKAQRACRRSGSANSKTRSEVAGSTRKLYKQKGTGRARHGSIAAPVYVGGGKAHGPKPRDFSYRLTRKMRQGALRSALSLKVQEGTLTVVHGLALPEAKTKSLIAIMNKLELHDSAIFMDIETGRNLRLASRNLQRVMPLAVIGANPYDILRHKSLVVSQSAVAMLTQRLRASSKPSASTSEAQG